MSGPLEARMKYGKPTEIMSNLNMSSTGVLTSFGFQLESGIIGEVQINERNTRVTIARPTNDE